MNYFKMMEINLLEISSYEDAIETAKTVIDSDKNDILKYINYLRYTYNTCNDIDLMDKITQFLFIEELAEIERNSDIDFGETLDLNLTEEITLKEDNTLNIEDVGEFVCVAQLSDEYETILILRDKDNEYHKYGCIDDEEHRGNKYVYLLEKENPEFYQRIIDSKIGTKANIISAITSDQSFRKTFSKEEIDVGYRFIISQKTNKGIFSNIITGTFVMLKEPEVILKDSEPIIEESSEEVDVNGNNITMDAGNSMGISIEGVGTGSGIGMMSGDDFMDMMNQAGGAEGLAEKMKSDIFADMLGENIDGYDEDMKNMISDSVRLSDEEFQEKWQDKLEEIKNKTPNNTNIGNIEDVDEDVETENIINIDKVVDDKTQFKNIKSFKNQDIIILGACSPDDYSDDLGITDDESGFKLSYNGKIMEHVESDGFINIITFKDYLDNYKHEDNFDVWQKSNTFIIRNFTGDVNLITKVDNKQVDPDTLGKEYLCHDHDYAYDVDIDVIIDLKTQNNIKIIRLTPENIDEFTLNISREKKLERVFEDEIDYSLDFQQQLDTAIENENYELAEKIKEKLENNDEYSYVLTYADSQIGKIVEIANKEDYEAGFTASLTIGDDIDSLTEENSVFEIMEGTYECEDISDFLSNLVLIKTEKIKNGNRYFVRTK